MNATDRSTPLLQPHQHRHYGRRKGRALTKSKAALFETLLPQLKIAQAALAPVDPKRWFSPSVHSVWLEIGFGAGEHLAWQAKNNPDVGLLGAEVFVNGIASLLKQIEQEQLENIRIHPDDVHTILPSLTTGCLARVFLLFPDPWPKRRHVSRRFLGRANVDVLARLMKSGAELRFASDDPAMIAWGLAQLTGHPEFRWLAEGPDDWRVRPVDWPETRYERKAIREGRRPQYFRFTRR